MSYITGNAAERTSEQQLPLPTAVGLPAGTTIENVRGPISNAQLGALVQRQKIFEQGQFGITYKGKDNATGREYAIKLLPYTDGIEPGARDARFDAQRERVITKAAECFPGLACFVNAFEVDGTEQLTSLALVTRWVDGVGLSDAIKAHMPATNLKVSVALLALFNAILYLHSQGIVHRDVHPGNIIMSAGCFESDEIELCEPTLIDFGKSCLVKESGLEFLVCDFYKSDSLSRLEELQGLGAIYYTHPSYFKAKTNEEKVDAIMYSDIWGAYLSIYQWMLQQPIAPTKMFAETRWRNESDQQRLLELVAFYEQTPAPLQQMSWRWDVLEEKYSPELVAEMKDILLRETPP